MNKSKDILIQIPIFPIMAFNGFSYHYVAVGAEVINYVEEFLVIRETRQRVSGVKTRLTIPGGIYENGEMLIDGAIREIKEETNYDIEILGLLSVHNWLREVEWEGLDVKDGIDLFYAAKLIGGEPVPQQGREYQRSFGWIDNKLLTG